MNREKRLNIKFADTKQKVAQRNAQILTEQTTPASHLK